MRCDKEWVGPPPGCQLEDLEDENGVRARVWHLCAESGPHHIHACECGEEMPLAEPDLNRRSTGKARSEAFVNTVCAMVVESEKEEPREILYRAEQLMSCAESLVVAATKKMETDDAVRHLVALEHVMHLVGAGKAWLNERLWQLGYYGGGSEGG